VHYKRISAKNTLKKVHNCRLSV